MADTIRIYRRILASRLRSQWQYRASFAMTCATGALVQGLELITILVLFGRTPGLGGFARTDVLLMFAIASVSFGLAQLAVGPVDTLPDYIRKGTFDVLLIRPLSTLAQLVTTDVRFDRIGRISTGIGVLVYVLATAEVHWTPATAVLTVIAPLAGSVIIASVWVSACSATFWLIEARELSNSVTYGSNFFTSYPITVFSDWLRQFLAFVVPGAFVSYYPSLAILGRTDPLGGPAWLSWISPLIAVGAAFIASGIWKFAVRHYRGTGS